MRQGSDQCSRTTIIANSLEKPLNFQAVSPWKNRRAIQDAGVQLKGNVTVGAVGGEIEMGAIDHYQGKHYRGGPARRLDRERGQGGGRV